MKLFVHVGPHKTGTSAIQAFLHRNHVALRQRGAWYLGTGGTNNHTLLGHAFLRGDPAAPDMLERYIAAAGEANCGTCILSSESFSKRTFDPTAFLRVLEGRQATFVAYLRRPHDRLVSVFDQLVRQKRRVAPLGKNETFDATYVASLGKWAAAEGHRLQLAPYDPPQWTNGSLLDDFLAMVGVDAAGLDRTLEPGEMNRSLPPGLTEVLRLANGLDIAEATRESLVAGLRQLAETRPDLFADADVLGPDRRAALRRALRDSLHLWRPYYRPGFDERFLVDDPDGPDRPARG